MRFRRDAPAEPGVVLTNSLVRTAVTTRAVRRQVGALQVRQGQVTEEGLISVKPVTSTAVRRNFTQTGGMLLVLLKTLVLSQVLLQFLLVTKDVSLRTVGQFCIVILAHVCYAVFVEIHLARRYQPTRPAEFSLSLLGGIRDVRIGVEPFRKPLRSELLVTLEHFRGIACGTWLNARALNARSASWYTGRARHIDGA